MRFILIGLVFYLLVTAYFAAQRVMRKRRMQKDSAQSSPQNLPQTSSTSIPEPSAVTPQAVSTEENVAPEASGVDPIAKAEISEFSEQDIALPEPESAPLQEISAPIAQEASPEPPAAIATPDLTAPEIPEPAASMSEESSEATPSTPMPIGSPMMINPDADLILAASVSVTDLVNPESSASAEIPDLIPTDPAISEVLNANSEQNRTHHPSVLEEIAQLRPMANSPSDQSFDDRTRQFMHALLTGDGTVRVAAVYELGEIASQGSSNSEQIIQQLQQLTQDEDPDVRLQAIAALAKVQR